MINDDHSDIGNLHLAPAFLHSYSLSGTWAVEHPVTRDP